MGDEKKSKGRWWEIFISSGLFTGIAIAFVGYITSGSLEKWKTNETRTQLYAELMGKREEAESALRKDMFTSIIGSFLSTEKASGNQKSLSEKQVLAWLEEKVLNLELLVSNFHESLNLKPLFIYLKKIINDSNVNGRAKTEYVDRLNKIAKEITRKQMLVLEGAGDSFSRVTVLKRLSQDERIKLQEEALEVNGITRIFRIVVLEIHNDAQEIKVRLEVIRKSCLDEEEDTYTAAEFSVGFFDFPMIDNIRLSHDQRCSIVLDNFYESPELSDSTANITLIAFPGSHASLKEKPYYEEIVHNLLNASKS